MLVHFIAYTMYSRVYARTYVTRIQQDRRDATDVGTYRIHVWSTYVLVLSRKGETIRANIKLYCRTFVRTLYYEQRAVYSSIAH